MMRRVVENTEMGSGRNSRLKAMEALSKKHAAFRPGGKVLTPLEVVPTIFPQYDHALRIGGHPIARVVTIHGPSNHGKTEFLLGLGKSFLRRDHFFKLIDAEYTTSAGVVNVSDEDWLRTCFGPSLYRGPDDHHPGFTATRPRSYEDTVDEVRDFCTTIEKEKKAGNLEPDVTALIGVDSLRKLNPMKLLEKLLGSGAKKGAKANGIDGFGGRGAQIKAGLNAAWLDELTPLLYHTRTTLVFIARESEDTEADANDKKWGNDYKVTGGKAVIFDSSIVARIERASWVHGPGPEGEKKPVYGERHRITVKKTKVASKTDKVQVAHFHTSNGIWTPKGFDLARDVFELAMRFGVMKNAGAWYSLGRKRWQGEHNVVKALAEDEDLLMGLESDVRACFDANAPIEEDE